MIEISFKMAVEGVFRLELPVWTLRRREKNNVDMWNGDEYCRIIFLDDLPVKMSVSQRNATSLNLRLESHEPLSLELQRQAQVLAHKLLGLNINLRPFYHQMAQDQMLRQLAHNFVGMRPPCFPTVFEALLNAILCQQVSLESGLALLNRVAETYGARYFDGSIILYALPRPQDLVAASDDRLRELGLSRQKTRAILELADRVVTGKIKLDQLESLTNEQCIQYLQTIHGIGRWSAEYTLLRGLGRLDVFPGDDIGGQNNIRTLFRLESRPDYDQLKILTIGWHPYEGLIYFHLLLEQLQAKGLV
jgi:DNA-3-methyladenine glycosylase II